MKPGKIALHFLLFVITFFTTTVAGVQWLNLDPFDLNNFTRGLPYSISILFILSCHEFGHYFAARYHKVDATLPFYMPFPAIDGFLNFGTLGAVIRTRSPIPSKKAMFDIGVAGPIAGFIATLIVLVYGFLNLPGKEFILRIHPDYFSPVKTTPAGIDLAFGHTALYDALAFLLTDPLHHFVPPMSEMYHYPFLCTGWFGLFVTAMNLLPVGQLDGGHISYTMFGDKHKVISHITFIFILIIGLLGFLPLIGITPPFGWTGWFFWGLILFFVVKLNHPPVLNEEPLDNSRILIGWGAFFIFLLSFSPSPFSISI
jgi:membrane-associated protease RseP (regulator of RpoE activity)